MTNKEIADIVVSVLQTIAIIIALIISIRSFSYSRKDIKSRLRPFVFIDKTNVDFIYINDQNKENLIGLAYQLTLKNIGQTPAMIKLIQIEEELKKDNFLLKDRPTFQSSEQIIYPYNNVHIAVPPLNENITKLLIKNKEEDIYSAKIKIIYSSLGQSDEYIYERYISMNPNIITGTKIALKKIIEIN